MDRLRRSPRSGLPAAVVLNSGGGGFAADGDGNGGGGGGGGASLGAGVRVSPRSGVVDYDSKSAAAAAAGEERMREKMTGRSAGGPQTAVGYLLGELRMRPEEVR